LSIHSFSRELVDKVVHFQVLKMSGSLYFWIGTSASLSNLCVAMQTKYEDMPATSCLLGTIADVTSSTLAQKLAKRTKKQIFVSYNLQMDTSYMSLVEKAVIDEMQNVPDMF
ncbi:predicted protein, partial [Nematostella vectensis]